MEQERFGLARALPELGRSLGSVIRQPMGWLPVVAMGTGLHFGLSLIPVLGPLALTLLFPVLLGGLLQRAPAYLAGEPPAPAHLFAAFRDPDLKKRLLGVGGWSLAFGLFLLAVSLVLMALLALPALAAEGPAAAGGQPGMTLGLGLAMGLQFLVQFLLVSWFGLALFLGMPLVVFEGSEPIPALRGGARAARRRLPFLLPLLLFFAGVFAWDSTGALFFHSLALALITPVLILFQFRAYQLLGPAADPPDPG